MLTMSVKARGMKPNRQSPVAERSMKCRNKSIAGFTLIEIMLVVVLIGLLAGIAVPNMIRTRTTTRTNACINNLRVIEYAIQQWALESRKDASSIVEFSDISPYMRRSVLCPAGGTSFANSYEISTVASQPICQRVPGAHLLPLTGFEVVTSAPTSPPPAAPTGPAAPASPGDSGGSSDAGGGGNPTPGNGNGNGNGNGGGHGHHGGKP